jgi:hypothetical protein
MAWEKKETLIVRVLNSDKYSLKSSESGSERIGGNFKMLCWRTMEKFS